MFLTSNDGFSIIQDVTSVILILVSCQDKAQAKSIALPVSYVSKSYADWIQQQLKT